jgi:hypothetical protein
MSQLALNGGAVYSRGIGRLHERVEIASVTICQEGVAWEETTSLELSRRDFRGTSHDDFSPSPSPGTNGQIMPPL